MQDVVATTELLGLLHRHDVAGVLDHTQDRAVAPGVVADRTQLPFGHVEAPGAQRGVFLHRHDGLGQPDGVLGRHLQDVEGQALRGLGADAGETSELVHQRLERAGVHP